MKTFFNVRVLKLLNLDFLQWTDLKVLIDESFHTAAADLQLVGNFCRGLVSAWMVLLAENLSPMFSMFSSVRTDLGLPEPGLRSALPVSSRFFTKDLTVRIF